MRTFTDLENRILDLWLEKLGRDSPSLYRGMAHLRRAGQLHKPSKLIQVISAAANKKCQRDALQVREVKRG